MITILLAEDHPLMVQMVRQRLEKEPDLSLVADTAFRAEVVSLVRELQPDVVILDIALADGNSLAVISDIHAARANTRIIVFSLHDYASYLELPALKGISKFISKQAPIDELIQAIRHA